MKTHQMQLHMQSTSNGSERKGENMGILVNLKFDQVFTRKVLTRMVMVDEFSFKFVEHEGFRQFVLNFRFLLIRLFIVTVLNYSMKKV